MRHGRRVCRSRFTSEFSKVRKPKPSAGKPLTKAYLERQSPYQRGSSSSI